MCYNLNIHHRRSICLNEYGKIAYDEWAKTPIVRSNVQLGEFVVMPNHIHGIIVIANKIMVPCRGVLHTPLRSPSQTVEAIIRGYKSLCFFTQSLIGLFLLPQWLFHSITTWFEAGHKQKKCTKVQAN